MQIVLLSKPRVPFLPVPRQPPFRHVYGLTATSSPVSHLYPTEAISLGNDPGSKIEEVISDYSQIPSLLSLKISQEQPRRPRQEEQQSQPGVEPIKYGDVFSVSGDLASKPIAPQDAVMMQSAKATMLREPQRGSPVDAPLWRGKRGLGLSAMATSRTSPQKEGSRSPRMKSLAGVSSLKVCLDRFISFSS